MPNKLLLAAAETQWLRRMVTTHPFGRSVASRFVAGETLEHAIKAAQELSSAGIASNLDYLGEHVTNDLQAEGACLAYLESLDGISKHGLDAHVSVKLTQLGLNLDRARCLERMEKICMKATEVGSVVEIDMESHAYTASTIELYRTLRKQHSGLVICLQAYLHRTEDDIRSILDADPSVRLCKGAYNEPRDLVFNKKQTNRSFRRIMGALLKHTSHTSLATHDESVINAALALTRRLQIPSNKYEFQMLFGVRLELQSALVSQNQKVRVYIPFGDEWYPYLMRRLAERPANLRFFIESLVRR